MGESAHTVSNTDSGIMEGIPELYAWLEAQGAERHVDVCESAYGGRGLCANAALQPGDVCLRIPHRCVLAVLCLSLWVCACIVKRPVSV